MTTVEVRGCTSLVVRLVELVVDGLYGDFVQVGSGAPLLFASL